MLNTPGQQKYFARIPALIFAGAEIKGIFRRSEPYLFIII